MKKIIAFAGAVIFFLMTCVGIKLYLKQNISENRNGLIYYGPDNRNFCKTAMEEVLTKSGDVIPVFGSSELWVSDDNAYPQSLFQNGNSDFNMVLIGRGYMQSLHHTMNIGAMANIIPNKKVVLILSPQWFAPSQLTSDAYVSRFSERIYVEFLKNPDISHNIKSSVTERLKTLLAADPTQLKRVEKYEDIYVTHRPNILKYLEMSVYDAFMDIKQMYSLNQDINSQNFEKNSTTSVKIENIRFDELMEKAVEAGKRESTNNEFYIYDEYYNTYVRDWQDAKKDSEINSSYLESPEYDDFRLFLDICKETEIEPLIVNIPVNGRWYDWIGFPKEEREAYYQKIRSICEDYQVQIADFSDKEYEEYFLKDIMHLGWKGWVYLDEAIYHFYKEDKQ